MLNYFLVAINCPQQRKIDLYTKNLLFIAGNSILRRYFTIYQKELIFTGILYSQQQ